MATTREPTETEETQVRAQSDGVEETPRQEAAKGFLANKGALWGMVGLLLLALYLVVLARNDIDAGMGDGSLPKVPGGWKSLGALIVIAAAVVAAAAARPRREWLERARLWALAHQSLLAIGGISFVALALRVYGISDNLPYINQPDEPAVADKALGILKTGDYNVHYFVYPNLYYYMQAALYVVRFMALVSSGTIDRLDQAVPTDFYLWGRLMTAVLGMLTVVMVYLAARRLYGVAVGLVAAALMATNSVHMLHSQFITTDAPATFFCALAMVAIAWLMPVGGQAVRTELPSMKLYLLAGVAAGLAIGTKYNNALILLPLLIAHGYRVAWGVRPGERLRAFFGGRLWMALGVAVLTFFATTPFALFDLSIFLNDIGSVVSHYRYGHEGHEGNSNWLFYASHFLQTDTLPTLLSMAGVIVAFVRRRPADVLMVSFPLALYFSMSSYRVNFDRNLLPLLPFTSILAGVALVLVWEWISRDVEQRRLGWSGSRVRAVMSVLLALVVVVAVWPATIATAQRDYRQTQPDNRTRAVQWLDQNTKPGTKVWLEPLTPSLDPGRYLTGHGDHVTEHPMDWYAANRYDYLVVSAGAYKSVVYDNPESDPPLRDAYLKFFDENASRLVADFETNKVDHPGPSIRIYKTTYTPPATVADVHPQHVVDAVFTELGINGGSVRLLGADFPAEVKAGEGLPIVLYWSTQKPFVGSFTEFVHFVDASGSKKAQRDTAPKTGTYPTSLWQRGEIVVDEAGLNLPEGLPAGIYTVRVGLYLQSDGQALPGPQASGGPAGSTKDYVLLGTVTVK